MSIFHAKEQFRRYYKGVYFDFRLKTNFDIKNDKKKKLQSLLRKYSLLQICLKFLFLLQDITTKDTTDQRPL